MTFWVNRYIILASGLNKANQKQERGIPLCPLCVAVVCAVTGHGLWGLPEHPCVEPDLCPGTFAEKARIFLYLRQHRTIPALRLKHRFGGSPRQEPPQAAVALRSASLRLGVRHGICVAKMLDNVGLRYPHRASGQKPLALCDRCPCFGSLYPPLAALTFAASSIICAFGLAAAAPRSPYRHLELCGIALNLFVTR